MIKREFKVNLKSFCIWTLILVGLFLMEFLLYPSMINDETQKSMDELMKVFPPEVLKTFNMDIADISTAFGWMKSEGFIFVLLITGVYASIMGTQILLKEESEHTSEYLSSLPVKRSTIVVNKVICATSYIIIMVVIVGIFNFIGLSLVEKFDTKRFVLLSITPILSSIVLFAVSLFISTFAKKTKKVLGLGLGLVFASYFLNMLSEMSDKVRFLRYFSTFTLSDIRNVISDAKINPVMIVIAVMLYFVFVAATVYRYERKEL